MWDAGFLVVATYLRHVGSSLNLGLLYREHGVLATRPPGKFLTGGPRPYPLEGFRSRCIWGRK